MNKYDSIINLPHYELKYHKRMSMESRAAQFCPFAALTGYTESIKETARITSRKIELSDEEKLELDRKLQILNDNIKDKPDVVITYFIKDIRKSGGRYEEVNGNIRKIDYVNHVITLTNNKKIYISDILNITSSLT